LFPTRRVNAFSPHAPHSQADHLDNLQTKADEEAIEAGMPPEEPPEEEGPVPLPRVVANPKTATLDDLYHDLEAVPFPEERIQDNRVRFPPFGLSPHPRKGFEVIRRPPPAPMVTPSCGSCTGAARRDERQ